VLAGRYEIDRLLGAGGHGRACTRRATWSSTNRSRSRCCAAASGSEDAAALDAFGTSFGNRPAHLRNRARRPHPNDIGEARVVAS